jgi:hypothetical protein
LGFSAMAIKAKQIEQSNKLSSKVFPVIGQNIENGCATFVRTTLVRRAHKMTLLNVALSKI